MIVRSKYISILTKTKYNLALSWEREKERVNKKWAYMTEDR